MTNPYFDIINHEENDWDEFLDKICLIDIFKPVLQAYHDNHIRKAIIKYITMCYHADSDAVIMGMEWQKNKQVIFERVGLTNLHYADTVLLKKPEVLKTINKLLEFQDNESWSSYCMLKDLIIEMRLAANSPILKSTGEIDYKVKKDCADYTTELYNTLKDVEQKFIQSNPKMKEPPRRRIRLTVYPHNCI